MVCCQARRQKQLDQTRKVKRVLLSSQPAIAALQPQRAARRLQARRIRPQPLRRQRQQQGLPLLQHLLHLVLPVGSLLRQQQQGRALVHVSGGYPAAMQSTCRKAQTRLLQKRVLLLHQLEVAA